VGKTLSAFEHFVLAGQFEGRDTNSYFNQNAYLAANPDIQPGVAQGSIYSPSYHFTTVGQKEHRSLGTSAFNETAYLTQYPDVATAISLGRIASALEHFLWGGLREGRSPT